MVNPCMKPLFCAALAAIAFLFCQAPVLAQTQAGLRLGANTSKVTGDHVTSPSAMGIGYQAGLFVRVHALGLHLQPELLFTSRKYKFTQVLGNPGSTTPSEKEISSTYLDFPVYVLIDLTEKVNLLVGPML